MRLLAVTLLALMAVATEARAADRLTLYAAGSLKAALGDVAKAYEEAYGTPVGTDFAASGLLRERIEGYGRAGGAVRAEPAVRAGAART